MTPCPEDHWIHWIHNALVCFLVSSRLARRRTQEELDRLHESHTLHQPASPFQEYVMYALPRTDPLPTHRGGPCNTSGASSASPVSLDNAGASVEVADPSLLRPAASPVPMTQTCVFDFVFHPAR